MSQVITISCGIPGRNRFQPILRLCLPQTLITGEQHLEVIRFHPVWAMIHTIIIITWVEVYCLLGWIRWLGILVCLVGTPCRVPHLHGLQICHWKIVYPRLQQRIDHSNNPMQVYRSHEILNREKNLDQRRSKPLRLPLPEARLIITFKD